MGAIRHTYQKSELLLHESRHQEKVAFPGQLGNVSWKNNVIIDMFVYMICRNFVCNATVQYYLFMSFL